MSEGQFAGFYMRGEHGGQKAGENIFGVLVAEYSFESVVVSAVDSHAAASREKIVFCAIIL
jgi:hypothetical protein